MIGSTKPKTLKKPKVPPKDPSGCKRMSADQTLEFILGVHTEEWKLADIRGGVTDDGVKVTHITLEFKGAAGLCPACGKPMAIHDYKDRSWRHSNLDDTVCYLYARVPRCRCDCCGSITQIQVPWADPGQSYTHRFEELAIEYMSQMSIAATARRMIVSWDVLDGIVGRVVKMHLDRMDLSCLRRIRVDETAAKKHHRYITIITDADTGNIVFITKGKDADTIKEFADWLVRHKGDPENIELIATDFGEAHFSGAKVYLPNAERVLDPFHLVQIANRHLDHDRAQCQVNGERTKSVRYALLKNPENLREDEREALMDITKDFESVGTSYKMKESLRQLYTYTVDQLELARQHLVSWAAWAAREGTRGFRALAKTVSKNIDGILRAIETGVNNGYQESLNGRVQLSKAIGRGYHREMRLGRIVFFRDIFREY